MMTEHPLDNAIWHALTSRCDRFAHRSDRAAVFDPEVAKFAALADRSPTAWADLAALTDATALFGIDLDVPDDWDVTRRLRCHQMLLATELPPVNELVAASGLPPTWSLSPLGPVDVGDMTGLVALTEPGPFVPRTVELGGYLGVRDGDRLIAMAGRRVQLDPPDAGPGFVEVSLVCVDPAYRGRRLGDLVTAAVAAGVQADGDAVYLHVMTDNTVALRLYERLGFRHRADIDVVIIQRLR